MTITAEANRRVVLTGRGSVEKIEVIDEAAPSPGVGEARLRIEAAGAAFGDVGPRRGLPGPGFPFTPGYDAVGTVDAVGNGVTRVAVGDRVAAFCGTGGQQRFICLAEDEFVPLPDSVSSERAAALVLNYVTAYQLLVRAAKLKAGQTVFAYGLSGGVGSALRDIGPALDITVVGTASGARIDTLRRDGVQVFDRHATDLAGTVLRTMPKGFDAVLDPLGGASLDRSYRMVARGGTLVMFGAATAVQGGASVPMTLAGTMGRLLLLKLRPDGRDVTMYVIPSFKKKHPLLFREDLTLLLGWLRDGRIDPQIAEVVTLDDARRIQGALEAGSVEGKIIFKV